MIRKLILSLIISLCAITVYGQEEGPLHWMAFLSAGFNTDGYEAEVGCSWRPVDTFGVNLSIGIASEIEEIGDWDWLHDNDDYYYDEHGVYASRFKFTASLDLRSPTLIRCGESASLHLYATPGLGLSPGASGSNDAKVTFWQAKGGVELDVDDFVFRLGYGYSDFNLYSGNPYSHNGYSEDPNRHTHSVTLTIGARF